MSLWLLWTLCHGALRRLLPSWRFYARYQAFPIDDLVAVVDPVSPGIQKIAPVLEVLLQVPGFSCLLPCGCCGPCVTGLFLSYDLVAVVDPVSLGVQKIAPVLEVLPRVPTRLFLSMTLWLLWTLCRGALRRLLPSWRFSARYQAFSIYDLVAVVDPVSLGAQKIAPVLEVLRQVPSFFYL
jgi:hypothetical protein